MSRNRDRLRPVRGAPDVVSALGAQEPPALGYEESLHFPSPDFLDHSLTLEGIVCEHKGHWQRAVG